MIVDKTERLRIVNEFYHRQEEKFLRTLIGFTEERIKDIISQPPDYSINEYKGFSIGHLKQDLKFLVTDEYYQLGGIDFDPEIVMKHLKNTYKSEKIVSVRFHGRRIEVISIVNYDDGSQEMVSRMLVNRLFKYSNEWGFGNFCPECYSYKDIETTAELNEKAKCNCGWNGKMNELLYNEEEIINHKRDKKLNDILQ